MIKIYFLKKTYQMKLYGARVNNEQIIVSSNPFINFDDSKNLGYGLNDSIMDGGYDIFDNILLKDIYWDSFIIH